MGLVLGLFLAPETNIIFGDGVGASLVSINCPVLCLLDGESDSGSCPAVGNAFTAHQGNFFQKASNSCQPVCIPPCVICSTKFNNGKKIGSIESILLFLASIT